MLILQHQQRSSVDTEALEDEGVSVDEDGGGVVPSVELPPEDEGGGDTAETSADQVTNRPC
jgi:hypothetical protein